MPRAAPETRLQDLVEAASAVFIERGYRRTQMDDVARAMGVAKGTLYLYVESKDALFYTALLYADGRIPSLSELELPIPTPKPGALSRALRDALAREVVPASLRAALERRRVRDVRAEFEAIVRDLFAVSLRHRTAIKLVDRCGRDHPELDTLFYTEGRFVQLELLVRYLESRRSRGLLRPLPDVATAARFVIESVATWAVHIHWDPAPQPITPEVAEETVVHFVLCGLLKE